MHRLPTISLALIALLFSLLSLPAQADIELDIVRQLIADQDYPAALSTLDTLENSVEAQLLRGVIQTKLGQLNEATQTFERLSDANPRLPQPWNNLAVLYASRGMIEQARSALLHAVELQPKHANAHRNLGDLYIHLALDAYSQAIALEPDNRHLAHKITAIEAMLGRQSQRSPPQAPSNQTPPQAAPTAKPSTNAITQSVKTAPTSPSSNTTPTACLRIGPVKKITQLQDLKSWLLRNGAEGKSTSEDRAIGEIFQLYLSPFPSHQAAKKQLDALRAKDIKDAVVIRSGSLTHGISLGAFKQHQLAQKRVRQLNKKGVSQVQIRSQHPRHRLWYIDARIKDPKRFQLDALKQHYPKLKTQPSGCG